MKCSHLLNLFLFLCLAACGSNSVGTSVGNPNKPTVNFSTTSTASSSNLMAAVTPSHSYCSAAGENSNGAQTQQCHGTPNNYNLGILAIYLVDCLDSDGVSISCNSTDVASLSRTALYNGDQVDTEISETQTSFSGTSNSLTSDLSVGGVQVVTSYIEQKFPETGDEADKIMTALRGKSYRICIADENEIDATTMETRCGHEDAAKGDYLIDMDGDGTFGFMVNVTTTSVEESSTKPSDYSGFNDSHFATNQVCFSLGGGSGLGCSSQYTSADFYGTAGYFAPLMPLTSVTSLTSATAYSINVEFNIHETFAWTDGADAELADASTCVGEISDQCEAGSASDSDSGSVGTYNPYYDTAFLPNVPSSTVTISEGE